MICCSYFLCPIFQRRSGFVLECCWFSSQTPNVAHGIHWTLSWQPMDFFQTFVQQKRRNASKMKHTISLKHPAISFEFEFWIWEQIENSANWTKYRIPQGTSLEYKVFKGKFLQVTEIHTYMSSGKNAPILDSSCVYLISGINNRHSSASFE